MDSKQYQISFDDANRIRLLEPDKFKQTEELAVESEAFVSKLGQFSGAVQSLVQLMTEQSKQIEQHKLLAIGQRHRVAKEIESRDNKKHQLQALIRHKKLELERRKAYLDSLKRIETEQKVEIEKLSRSME